MVLQRICIRQVDRMRLVCIFDDNVKMKSQGFTKSTKFSLALVFEAEFEGLLCNLLKGF